MSKTSIFLMIGTMLLLGLLFFLLKTGQFKKEDVVVPDTNVPSSDIGEQDIIHTELPVLETVSVTRVPQAGPLKNLVSNPSPEFLRVADLFWPNEIYVFECRGGVKGAGKTILFTAQYTQDPAGNNFRAAMAAIEAWEPQVAHEIGPLLYPSQAHLLQDAAVVSDFVPVPGTDYKKATFTLGAQQDDIYYSWLLNNVLFSTSQECLDAAVLDFYAPNQH
ncbi:hypothetical protein KC887_08895 [Candidatus Kaiserbacteria bacterium]|nr:hypothetical protein [Candidatus Kaiserbacteria bacterium]